MSTIAKITCRIPELHDWQFSHLVMDEKVGDELPTGTLGFLGDPDNEDLSIDSLTLDLIINDEYQISTKAYVEEARNYNGKNEWKLIFTPKEFFTDSNIREFNGVKSLVRNLSPYQLLNNPQVDCGLEGEKLYQHNIPDFQCIIKYLKALQKNQVYAFRVDGLYFSDLTQKPKDKINIASIARFIPLSVRRNKLSSLEATQFGLDTNSLVNIHYSNRVMAVTKKSAKAYSNYLENKKIFKCLEDNISYDFADYMDLRAGDLIKLTGSNYESNNYLVVSNHLDMTPGGIKNKLVFSAI